MPGVRKGSSIQTFPARWRTRATPVVKEQPRCRGKTTRLGSKSPEEPGLLPVAFGAGLIAAGTRAALAGRVRLHHSALGHAVLVKSSHAVSQGRGDGRLGGLGQVDRGRSASIGGDAWQVLNWPSALVVPRRSMQTQIRRRSPAGMRSWQHIFASGVRQALPYLGIGLCASLTAWMSVMLFYWFCRKFIDAGNPY